MLLKNTVLRNRFLKFINIFLFILILIIPFANSKVFNKDLLMYSYLRDIILNGGLIDSLTNNTGVFYFVFFIFSKVDPFFTLQIFQALTIFLFYYCFRNIKSELLLSLILIFFFTMFSNQIRTALSLCFGYLAINSFKQNNFYKTVLFVFFAFLSHFLVGLVFLVFLFFNTNKKTIFKIVLFFFSFVALIVYYNKRFLFYFKWNDYFSFLSLFSFLLLFILKKCLNEKQFFVLLFLNIFNFFIGFQACLASRVSEVLIFILFIVVDYNSEEGVIKNYFNMNKVLFYTSLLSFTLFIYRFVVIYFFEENSMKFKNFLFNYIL